MQVKYYYIIFLNKKKNFATDMKRFKKYPKAVKWMIKNLENANTDMIKAHLKK